MTTASDVGAIPLKCARCGVVDYARVSADGWSLPGRYLTGAVSMVLDGHRCVVHATHRACGGAVRGVQGPVP